MLIVAGCWVLGAGSVIASGAKQSPDTTSNFLFGTLLQSETSSLNFFFANLGVKPLRSELSLQMGG